MRMLRGQVRLGIPQPQHQKCNTLSTAHRKTRTSHVPFHRTRQVRARSNRRQIMMRHGTRMQRCPSCNLTLKLRCLSSNLRTHSNEDLIRRGTRWRNMCWIGIWRWRTSLSSIFHITYMLTIAWYSMERAPPRSKVWTLP
jgi:hypothetical protein